MLSPKSDPKFQSGSAIADPKRKILEFVTTHFRDEANLDG